MEMLRAIVQDYASTSESVGFKVLLGHYYPSVSVMMICNDMTALEEDGLIAAPHTSVGCVPFDVSYRSFVDKA